MKRNELQEIMEQVRHNLALLDNCEGPHDFSPFQSPLQKRKCVKCGGELPSHEALWYERGVQHGKATRE